MQTGIQKPIVCKKCGHRVGYLKIKPAAYAMLKKQKNRETFAWIFGIALITQVIAQIISDGLFNILN